MNALRRYRPNKSYIQNIKNGKITNFYKLKKNIFKCVKIRDFRNF